MAGGKRILAARRRRADPPDPVGVPKDPGDLLFLSCEDLADAGAEPIRVLREVLDEVELDVRPIISGRSWARQIPSDYQQLVQAGLAVSYDDFLEQVRTRSGTAGERFWRRQALPEVASNWGAVSADGAVDVVCVPSYGEDPHALYRLFAEIVGFSVSDLTIPGGTINASFGVVEVELFRRVNALLRTGFRRTPTTTALPSGDPAPAGGVEAVRERASGAAVRGARLGPGAR